MLISCSISLHFFIGSDLLLPVGQWKMEKKKNLCPTSKNTEGIKVDRTWMLSVDSLKKIMVKQLIQKKKKLQWLNSKKL